MTRLRLGLAALALLAPSLVPSLAHADEPSRCPAPPLAVREWDPSAVALARELLVCARGQDEAALGDEKIAAALAAELPAKRAAAKAARDAAKKASADQREAFEARAEDLETEVIITEADIASRRNAAAEQRKSAKELRARAVRLVSSPSERSGRGEQGQGSSAELQRTRERQSDIF